MLLILQCTGESPDDLSWLLHKHPDRAQRFDLSFGRAQLFYPHNSRDRCAAALLVEVDPVALSRAKPGQRSTTPLEPYVNDRPYAASSMLSSAISQVLGSALNGRCEKRPELVDRPLELEATLPVVAAHGGGEALVRRLFEPLGYEVHASRLALDPHFQEWGPSSYWSVKLRAKTTVRAMLEHLYVMLPVLDDEQHYWVSENEVEKLLRKGREWLAAHPERELVTARFLKHQRALERLAHERLDADGAREPAIGDAVESELEARWSPQKNSDAPGKTPPLDARRREWVRDALSARRARRVVDLGCGEGKLLAYLAQHSDVSHVTGVDVSPLALEIAQKRLDRLGPSQRERVELLQGSLVYRDARLVGFDAATLIEVIEHVEPERLRWLEDAVFAVAKAPIVLVTTPNREANAAMPGVGPDTMRHSDHRFEWTRAEFSAWCARVAETYGYRFALHAIGDEHERYGAPTQAAIFEQRSDDRSDAPAIPSQPEVQS